MHGYQIVQISSKYLYNSFNIYVVLCTTVNSVIEDCLLFNFWTLGAVLYSSFYLIKVQIFPIFPVFYSRQSLITDFTVCGTLCKMQTFLKFAVLFYVPTHFNLFLPSHQLKRPCQNWARNSKGFLNTSFFEWVIP